MKTMFVVAFLALSSCVPWGNYRIVPSGGVSYDPLTGNQFYHVGATLAPGFHMDDESKEIFRGRTGSGGAGTAERVTSLTADAAKERAAAQGLRDQIVHIEGDLSTRTRERDAISRDLVDRTRELTERTAEVAKLRVELTESEDYYRYFQAIWERYGLFGIVVVLIFGLIGLRIWSRRIRVPKPATTE